MAPRGLRSRFFEQGMASGLSGSAAQRPCPSALRHFKVSSLGRMNSTIKQANYWTLIFSAQRNLCRTGEQARLVSSEERPAASWPRRGVSLSVLLSKRVRRATSRLAITHSRGGLRRRSLFRFGLPTLFPLRQFRPFKNRLPGLEVAQPMMRQSLLRCQGPTSVETFHTGS